MSALTDPIYHPKRHPEPFSRFATIHFPDRHTDRETDKLRDRSA